MRNTLSETHFLTPSESNAEQQLPLTLLISQIIELATAHANHLNIGFIKLDPLGLGWVLSRVTVEMRRWPKVGETYSLTTWMETFNRHYSERCFSVEDGHGQTIGYIRSVWVIIDLTTHKSAGTAGLEIPPELMGDRECPILRQLRHKPFMPQKNVEYTFKYTDLDFYRHVNTVRYISLLQNQFPLECYDRYHLSRFEIAFMNEAHYGETATISSIKEETETPDFVADGNESRSFTTTFDMKVESNPILRSRITFTER